MQTPGYAVTRGLQVITSDLTPNMQEERNTRHRDIRANAQPVLSFVLPLEGVQMA
ncbi:hypothetical protein JMJ77_0001896 [Colletotrichum scovillei]|uniref:Uncharacterized protein n=1 Tax=Colletotrichum scovillei TaxID=1209932 RepID=A0A9P7R6W7_9PEZI|nr:hypothetical protein JMJ77_0001896 [Colletotrichum scovillei]KAG7070307.1 hypothetical protein JMJ76_0001562 [Colletotrichum scovillei]